MANADFNFAMYPFTGITAGSYGLTASFLPANVTYETSVLLCTGDYCSAKLTLAGSAIADWGRLSNRNNDSGVPADFNLDSVKFEGFFRFDAFPATDSEEFLLLSNNNASGNTKAAMRINSGRSIQFHDNTAIASNTPTVLGTIQLDPGQTYFYQWTSRTGSSETGDFLLYSWDKDTRTAVLLETIACTGDWGADQTKRLWTTKKIDRNSEGYVAYFGRMWAIADGSDFKGPLIECRVAKANGSGTDNDPAWTASSGTTLSCVDEDMPPNGDTDYVVCSQINKPITFAMRNTLSAGVGVPNGAQIFAVAPTANYHIHSGAGAALISTRVRSGTDVVTLTPANPGTDVGVHARGPVWTENPWTASPWETTDITSIEVGAETGSDALFTERRLSWVGIFIWYVPPAAPLVNAQITGDGDENAAQLQLAFENNPPTWNGGSFVLDPADVEVTLTRVGHQITLHGTGAPFVSVSSNVVVLIDLDGPIYSSDFDLTVSFPLAMVQAPSGTYTADGEDEEVANGSLVVRPDCLPNVGHSTRFSLTVQEETEWGQLATGQNAISADFISESLHNDVRKSGARHVLGRRAAIQSLRGGHDPRGDLSGELQPHGLWPLLLKHALGDYQGTSGSDPYVHTVAGGETLPTGLTCEKKFGFRDGSVKRLRYYGGRVNTLSLRAVGDQIVTARAGLIFREEYAAPSDMDATPYAPADNEPFNTLHGQLLVTMDPDSEDPDLEPIASLRSVDLQIDNNLGDRDRPIAAGNFRGSLEHGRREVSGSIGAFFTVDNYRLYQGYLDNARFYLRFMLSRDDWVMTFLVRAIQFTGAPTPQVAARGPINLELPWSVYELDGEGGQPDIEVQISNSDPQLSTAV